MMLLIVEDNTAMRQLIRRVTGDLAERIVECEDGSEALAAYEEHHFGRADWVLMDVEMAVMDGLTASRQLYAAHPEARIVIVTRHNDEEARAAAYTNGACGFVPKENLLELRSLLRSSH
jgi:two-component system response regulator DegU